MNNYKLFLDDIRIPSDVFKYIKNEIYLDSTWEIVRNYDEFIGYIEDSWLHDAFPSIISFDHDLADEHYRPSMFNNPEKYNGYYQDFEEKTGMDCAKWLVEFCMDNDLELPEFHVHSMNPVGGQNILLYLHNYKNFE